MAYWLMKSEPETYSWEMLIKEGVTRWNGVRNYQATAYLKAMKCGDLAFFYHSGSEKQIKGVMQIIRESYLDPTDTQGRFVQVEVEAKQSLLCPVSLSTLKKDPRLQGLLVLKQPRLSVSPVDSSAWNILCTYGQTDVFLKK